MLRSLVAGSLTNTEKLKKLSSSSTTICQLSDLINNLNILIAELDQKISNCKSSGFNDVAASFIKKLNAMKNLKKCLLFILKDHRDLEIYVNERKAIADNDRSGKFHNDVRIVIFSAYEYKLFVTRIDLGHGNQEMHNTPHVNYEQIISGNDEEELKIVSKKSKIISPDQIVDIWSDLEKFLIKNKLAEKMGMIKKEMNSFYKRFYKRRNQIEEVLM